MKIYILTMYLFAGVGGIDLGFLNTKKCKIVYANEFDKYAKEKYELNFKILLTYYYKSIYNKLLSYNMGFCPKHFSRTGVKQALCKICSTLFLL